MNTNQHTVTLPIADYQELVDLAANADKKIIGLRAEIIRMVVDLKIKSSRPEQKMWCDALIEILEKSGPQ